MQYVQSDHIIVFPAAFRGSGYYKSRLTSEENLTLLSKYARSKYAVLKDGDYTIIIIEGYIFKLLTRDVPAGNNLYAAIRLGNDEGIGRLLCRVEETPSGSGDSTLDSDGTFFGLGFDIADKVKNYSANVLVRDASGEVFYSDVTEQTFAKNQAIVSNEEGKLVAQSLFSKQEANAATNNGIIKKITISQNDQGKLVAIGLEQKNPSPKDLTASNYKINRVLSITSGDSGDELTWVDPHTAAGVNDSKLRINGSQIWSANSSKDGNLTFSSRDFTFSDGTVQLIKPVPDPQNGVLQINSYNLFTANQATNSNLIFDDQHFNYDNALKKIKLQDDISLRSLSLKDPIGLLSKLTITNVTVTPTTTAGEIQAATTLNGAHSYITVGKDTTIKRDHNGKPESTNTENRKEFRVEVDQVIDNCAASLTKTLKSVGTSAQVDYHRVGMYLDTQSFTLTTLRENSDVASITGHVVEDSIKMDATTGTINCTTLHQSCDRRLKENITPYFRPYFCDQSILSLPVYTYNFIGQENKQIGCMAQDLQNICPEIVSVDTNGYLTVQESKIVYLLLEEIKKLRSEVDILKKEIH